MPGELTASRHDIGILDALRQSTFVALLTSDTERCEALHDLAVTPGASAVCLETNCESAFPLAFGPIADLLSQLLQSSGSERERLFAQFGPELAVWVPAVAREIGGAVPDLRSIAMGGAKRRLQSDSEILHRLFQAFPLVLTEALDRWESLAGKTLLIVFHNLDAADRLTLSCLTRLHAQPPTPRLRVVFSSRAGVGTQDRPWVWNDEAPPLEPSALELTDAHGLHERFWRTAFDRWSPVTLRVDEPRSTADPDVTDRERIALLLIALGAPIAVARAMMGLPAATADVIERYGRYMSRPLRRRLRRSIPLEQQCVLHDAIGAALVGWQAQGEDAQLVRAYHALRGTSPESGLPMAVEAASTALSWSFNYEAVLFCCRDILTIAGGSRQGMEYCRAAWQLIGLANSYVGRHSQSLSAFRRAYHASAGPEFKAQTSYYAGLVAGKRLRDHARASSWFERGIAHVRTLSAPLARLERGWLLNGSALLAWNDGRLDEAAALIRQGLATADGGGDAELLNLRVNLLNNLSVLYEGLNDPMAALETWHLLSEYAQRAPALIGRSFFYRDGWLRLAVADLKGAADSYRVAFALSECVDDRFHMDLTAMACGFVAAGRQRASEAREWYRRVIDLRNRHRAGVVAEGWACLGYVALQSGDVQQAWSAFDAGVLASGSSDGWASRLTAARDALDRGPVPTLVAGQPFCGISLVQPKSKLTSDFGVAELIAGVPLVVTAAGGAVA